MKALKIENVNELKPAFDGRYGWITITELNVIDPHSDRFVDVDEATFEDGTIFMLVKPVHDR